MDLLEKAANKNREKAAILEQTAEWARKHNLERFNEVAYDIDIYEKRVSIEIWPQQFKQARRLLGKEWCISRIFTGNTGARFHTYYHKNDEQGFSLTLMETPEGQTACKVIQTGVKEIPVYEIVCD